MKQSLIIILRGWRRGHSVKGVSHSKGKDSREWQKKTNKKKDQKQAFRFSCLRGSKEDKEQLGPGYPVLSGN